ncbi:Crp/Fnr family transcriptional regulator [Hyphomicrobium sp. DY-1]|uniref:Crp/Fnr family transcriptional regulator n=1 Tax=Hyphomicrobium sp. DY-1 TaxID=3075650 RepID=UPI0039C010AB
MKVIRLSAGQVLYRVGDCVDKIYFVNQGPVSSARTMEDGRTMEIGAVGIEGAVGAVALFGFEAAALEYVVSLPTTALYCKTGDLQPEVTRNPRFMTLLQQYCYLAMCQIAQISACNGLHKLEQRCCRWLLTAHDSARADHFQLTHEFLAMTLGVQRASISLTALTLQQEGYIQYKRGQITIIERGGLEATACECYGTIRRLFDRLSLQPTK